MKLLIKEDGEGGAPTNSMGLSSSTPGTGPIDTYDPLLFARKKVVRRIMGVWKKGNANVTKGRR